MKYISLAPLIDYMRVIVTILAFAALVSCTSPAPKSISTFAEGRNLAVIDSRIPEASGVAASVKNPGLLWTLNDSGNPPEVFLIDTLAKAKMICTLPVRNRDWEEIYVSTADDGKSYVYVADIGDNLAVYDTKSIYRFEEPTLKDSVLTIQSVDSLRFQMPDGKRDSEAIVIDPITKNLYIFSKREDSVRFYEVPQSFNSDVVTAKKLAIVPFNNVVAASVSPDGSEILVKNYDHIYLWRRDEEQPIEESFKSSPMEVSYVPEAQGESITWAVDGRAFFTLSEMNIGRPSYLRIYKKK